MSGFDIEKDKTKWIVAGTGDGWNLGPVQTDRIFFALNDYVFKEKYGVQPDLICIMDILDAKPQIVSGINNLGEIVKRINDMKCPLIAPYKYAEIPLSEAFPLEECAKEFGLSSDTMYFTNTIAYMIAFALLKGAKDIEIFGVNQASSSEYFYEKAGVEFWLGVAIGRGVKITINGDKSELLANKKRFGGNLLYGFNLTLQQVRENEKKFGTAIVKHLSAPSQPLSRTIRKINQ